MTDAEGTELTDTEVYQGELGAGDIDLEGLAQHERENDETDDPSVAAEEGMTWIPPIDPPVVPDPDNPEGLRVAAGFGVDAEAEPYDADHHSEVLSVDDEMAERVREALRADSATSMYADALAIATRGRVVAVRGVVDDIDDTDNVVEVISRVTGVDEVIEELEVRGVTD